MPIEGKEVVVPEQRASNYWLADLRVSAPTIDGPQELSALLIPITDDGQFIRGQRIAVKLEDLVTYAQTHASVAAAIATVLDEVKKVAVEQGKI